MEVVIAPVAQDARDSEGQVIFQDRDSAMNVDDVNSNGVGGTSDNVIMNRTIQEDNKDTAPALAHSTTQPFPAAQDNAAKVVSLAELVEAPVEV